MAEERSSTQLLHRPSMLAARPQAVQTRSESKSYNRRENLQSLIFISWGVLAWFLLMRFFPVSHTQLTALYLLLSSFLVTAVHEGGHLVADLLLGFRVIAVRVGPLQLERQFGGFKLDYDLQSLLRTGGSVSSLPPPEAESDVVRRRRLAIIAAGPLATILLLILLLVLQWRLSQRVILDGLSQMRFWLTYASLISLPLILIPYPVSWPSNDATRFLDLWRHPLPESDWVLARIRWASHWGCRPREFDPAWLKQLLQMTGDIALTRVASFWAYVHALDCGEVEQATDYLDRCLATIYQNSNKPPWPGCFIEAAYLEAQHGQRPEIARAWLELTQQHLPGHVSLETGQALLRAEAAVLLAEGRPEEAVDAVQRSLALLEQFTDIGNARTEEAWLTALASRCPPSG